MRPFTATLALVAMLGAQSALAQDGTDALRRAIDAHLANQTGAEDSDAAAVEPIPYTEDELDELLAPVALYPDALLAQVLVAATFPDQIANAGELIDASETLSEEELAARLEDNEWDPSVLVLTSGFPSVVKRMADDIDWTTDLGDAMVQQDEEVLASVQRLRDEALETGYLADNDAQVVETEDDRIAIKPKDPEVVYVPSYDPGTVYTSAPTAAPYIEQPRSGGGLLSNPLTAGAIAFGGALLVQELFGDDNDDDNDDGWDDYWDRSDSIDWRDRQVYARPRWADDNDQRRSWAWERDRYWDPDRGRWHRDEPGARRMYDAQRRDTVGWLVVPDAGRDGKPRVRAIRYDDDWSDERARRQAARAAEERREERLKEARREDRIEERRAEERREDRLAEERRQRRIEAARAETRDERKAEDRKAARAEQRRKQQAQEARQEQRADEQRKERREERQKEQATQERRDERQKEQAAEERRDERQKQEAADQRDERQKQKAAEDRRDERQKQKAAEDRRDERQKQKAAEDKKAGDAEKAAARKKAADRKQEAVKKDNADQKAKANEAAERRAADQKQDAAQQQERKKKQRNRKKSKCADDDKDCKP